MRTIKYRAWHKVEKRMYGVNGLLWDRDEHDKLTEMFLVDEINTLRHVYGEKTILDNYILMQFTGLFDKDGKEIYEGDIVSLCQNDGLWIIEWDEDGYHRANFAHNYFLADIDAERCIVVSNIYGNPKLPENRQ